MRKDDKGIYHSLRLSKDNPEHMKIHNVLLDLNSNLYKSKNQFIVEALLYYITDMENSPVTESRKRNQEKNDSAVTQGEFENAVKEMKSELRQYIDKEVLQVIIKVMSNNLSSVRADSVNEAAAEENRDEEAVDERLIELASSWS